MCMAFEIFDVWVNSYKARNKKKQCIHVWRKRGIISIILPTKECPFFFLTPVGLIRSTEEKNISTITELS